MQIMKIGIIVAMRKELELLLPLIENVESKSTDGVTLHCGRIGEHEVAAVQCGIGKVNSTITTMTLIRIFGPELVINTGVAGGADASMHPLDLFVAEAATYHDVWCGEGTHYGAADGFDVYLRAWQPLVEAARRTLEGPAVRYGLICSGDKFISTASEVAEIKSHFPEVLAVDMESGSIAQTCVAMGVPFNILRVISDTPGEADNISQYKNFWGDAPQETFRALRMLLKEF